MANSDFSLEDLLDLDEQWALLEGTTAEGRLRKNLHPTVGIQLFVDNPEQHFGLYLKENVSTEFSSKDLISSEDIQITHVSTQNSSVVELTCTRKSSNDIFKQIIAHLIPFVVAKGGGTDSIEALVSRFNAWQNGLKRSSGKHLSPLRCQGLYGELKTLESFLIPAIGAKKAVDAWTGPKNQPQDFQASGIALEVKTIGESEPQRFSISGERQLEDFGLDALILTHHRVLKHQGSGETLPELVENLRQILDAHQTPRDSFESNLISAGYMDFDSPNYENVGYSITATKHYRVHEGFPRITEESLRPGVGSLKYKVSASACEEFMVEEETIASWFKDAKAIPSSSLIPESSEIEYKETLWTPSSPLSPTASSQEVKSIEKSLKTSVVKTVVAFLNTNGGELVIGVRDSDLSVTGIEVDLLSKGKKSSDTDFFEQSLVTLLTTNIDQLVFGRIRIRFEDSTTGTTCHVNVRPSPSPRFGTDLTETNPNAAQKFWIRAGNTTQPLFGQEIVDWIADHWQ